MKLTSLQTDNFRLLEQFAVEFCEEATLIIGANNAGKSNLIDALMIVSEWTERQMLQALQSRQGFHRIVSQHDVQRTVTISLGLSDADHGDSRYSVTFAAEGILHERAQVGPYEFSGEREGNSDRVLFTGPETGISQPAGGPLLSLRSPELDSLRSFLRSFVHVDPFRMVAAQTAIGEKITIDPRGTDLAQVLHYHHSNDREGFGKYEKVVASVLPEVETIETPIVSGANTTAQLRFGGDPQKYNLWQVSSGVKDVLMLLAAIHFSEPGVLLLVEEPENHLHPASQKALCRVIKGAAKNEGKQFIISTHSEVILGQFEPEAVVFIDREGPRAHATRLLEADIYAVWQSLGIDRTLLLEVLGRGKQVIVVLEGRDDFKVLEPLWTHFALDEYVVAGRAQGGGWEEIVDSAADLRKCLARFRLRSDVFVLLDNDGERERKLSYLESKGFEGNHTHVWAEKEIESYLVLPSALSTISGESLEQVKRVIERSSGQGKGRLKKILSELKIPDAAKGLLVRNALARNAAEVPEELKEVPRKVRDILGLPQC